MMVGRSLGRICMDIGGFDLMSVRMGQVLDVTVICGVGMVVSFSRHISSCDFIQTLPSGSQSPQWCMQKLFSFLCSYENSYRN